ncbi:MAG: hypothetical protein MK100_08175 [Phycisphaerales bacterium]|nr:hypothetical protein [Phycisphaerales bacterium]
MERDAQWKRRRRIIGPVLILIVAFALWYGDGFSTKTTSSDDLSLAREAELMTAITRLCPGSTWFQNASELLPDADITWRLPLLREMFESRILGWCGQGTQRLECDITNHPDGCTFVLKPTEGDAMEIVFAADDAISEIVAVRMLSVR